MRLTLRFNRFDRKVDCRDETFAVAAGESSWHLSGCRVNRRPSRFLTALILRNCRERFSGQRPAYR